VVKPNFETPNNNPKTHGIFSLVKTTFRLNAGLLLLILVRAGILWDEVFFGEAKAL